MMAENDSNKKVLTKSKALEFKLDEKLNKVENNIRAEINTIKQDFESYKLLNYEEAKSIKKFIHELEVSQNVISEKKWRTEIQVTGHQKPISREQKFK